MVRIVLITWTFIAAVTVFLLGICVMAVPYGSFRAGLVFVILGLELGSGMVIHLSAERERTRRVVYPVRPTRQRGESRSRATHGGGAEARHRPHKEDFVSRSSELAGRSSRIADGRVFGKVVAGQPGRRERIR